MIRETFWTLLRDPAHWEFELFLMLLFDGLIFGLLWPFVRVHWRHHIRHDEADRAQDIDNAAIQHAMNQKLDVLSGRIPPLDPPIPDNPSLRLARKQMDDLTAALLGFPSGKHRTAFWEMEGIDLTHIPFSYKWTLGVAPPRTDPETRRTDFTSWGSPIPPVLSEPQPLRSKRHKRII